MQESCLEALFCVYSLSCIGEARMPTTAIAKDTLLKAGLGEKIVEFLSLEMNAEEMRDILYEAFPKLKLAGGFELCKGLPNKRGFEALSSLAYCSPQSLRERVGNSRTYIRPLQRELSLPGGVCIIILCMLYS